MKKIILFIMLLIMSAASFSQETKPSPALTKQDYLLKSKHQKTAAWVLLGGGLALTVTGIIVYSNYVTSANDPFTLLARANSGGAGGVLTAIGVLAMGGSIPLFLASGKNKKRAMSVSFKNETAPQIQKGGFVSLPVPSLALKIGL